MPTSSSPAIRIVDIRKRFLIGARQEGYATLRDVLAEGFLAPVRAVGRVLGRGPAKLPSEEELWALNGVSFDVNPGEVIGVVGRNGAGKSTLLKILSRITEPTSGYAEVRGRVGSLLEVGTGFHPELSGRENIYLNGAILGMKRTEIRTKFDEIVAFAEVDKFIDTPVKRYSSGMYLRLAFAVAAHLEPEILLVDEVLAVGDARFQRKCIGKMGDVAREGRTVLFVSHNMAAIQALCDRAVLLSNGVVSADGDVSEVIRKYMADFATESLTQSLSDRRDRQGTGKVRFTDFWIENEAGERLGAAVAGDPVRFCFAYHAEEAARDVSFAFNLQQELGDPIVNCQTGDVGWRLDVEAGPGVVACVIPKFPLRAARYMGNLHCAVNGVVADWMRGAFVIDAEDGDYYGTGNLPRQGKVLIEYRWQECEQQQGRESRAG